MNPTVDQLRVVCAVEAVSSFSDAARDLMRTQPAVTRTVRSLEVGLGIALFTRTTRRVEITPEGAEFVAVAREILASYDNGLTRFDAWRRAEVGAITVLVLPSLAAGVVAPIVAAFLRDRPAVRLTLLSANAEDILRRLRSGKAQLAITEHPRKQAGLAALRLASDPVCAVVRAGHPLADTSGATWTQLGDYPFIQLEEGTSVRRLTDGGFAAAGIRPVATLSADSIGTVSALIAQGLGVSAFPASTRSLVTDSQIRFVRLEAPHIARDLAVVTSATPQPSPLVRELERAIVAAWSTSTQRDPAAV